MDQKIEHIQVFWKGDVEFIEQFEILNLTVMVMVWSCNGVKVSIWNQSEVWNSNQTLYEISFSKSVSDQSRLMVCFKFETFRIKSSLNFEIIKIYKF